MRVGIVAAAALACAIVALRVDAAPPDALAFQVNGGVTPTINVAFDLVVRSTDGFTFTPVAGATSVALVKVLGSATLSGLTGCTIAAGASSCTVAGLVYSGVGPVGLDATVTSGDALAPAHYQFSVDRAVPAMSIGTPGSTPAGQATTFTVSVSGVAPTGNVLVRSVDAILCESVPLAGSGNTRSAACTVVLPVGTHVIAALYEGDALNAPTGVGDFTQFVHAASTNVALAANGGVATASSTIAVAGGNFGVAAVNDGSSTGVWGSGGGWNDATGGSFPDWVQIRLNGAKTIDKVVVTTLQDNFAAPIVPTDATTFSLYGVTAFQVQTWNGSSWTTRATVSGNTLVKRTVTFAPVTIDRLRILITGALASFSRIVEVEAWSVAPTIPTTTVLTSGVNPSPYPLPVTFTATVTGNAPTGTVTVRDGFTYEQLCVGTLVAGQASCVAQNLLPGERPIIATYHGDASHFGSASAPYLQVIGPPVAGPVNVALATSGGVATASSTYPGAGASFGVASVNDGIRAGTAWGQGGGWNDATAGQYPDWVEVAFAGPKAISQVVVYTLRDDFATGGEPGDATTFTQWGITAFDVQTWSGSAWVTQASVTGNTLAKRIVTFAPVATPRLRILVKAALNAYSRIVEVEAWSAGPVVTQVSLVSSKSPAAVGEAVTFTASVTGGAYGGTIRFDDGASDLCPPVPLGAGGATCTTMLPLGAHTIYARYSGSEAALGNVDSIEQQVVAALPSTNVALAANGGVATASSTIAVAGGNFGVAAVNDGSSTGVWGSGGGWNDATGGSFPDWVQIRLNGAKTIDKVVVTTLQDNFAAPIVPTDATTFSLYGVTAFQVQTWNGSSWTTRATVSGNTLVKRTVTFAPVTTDRLRILITGALASFSRIVEVEAWTAPGSTALAAKATTDATVGVKAHEDAVPIPTLGHAALALLAWLVALVGLRSRRRP